LADSALEASKACKGKNALTCFGETVHWDSWTRLEEACQLLAELRETEALSSGYVYRLLQFIDMRKKEAAGSAEAAIWRARFGYATRRYIVDKRRTLESEAARAELFSRLAHAIGGSIDSLGSSYRIALFNHLYQVRRS
jgi:CRISPR-associated protein Csm1